MNKGKRSQQKYQELVKSRLHFYNGGRGTETQGGDENQNPNLCDMNVPVDGQGLDVMTPTIPKPNKAGIKARFKIQVLTIIKGKLTYSWIERRLQVGRTLAFLLAMSDFKSETSFGFLSPNYTGQPT